ncbi:hypothetical protein N2152v2_004601 [Parachlorella kessleri]
MENQSTNSPQAQTKSVAKAATTLSRPVEWTAQYRQLQEQADKLEAECLAHVAEAGGRDASKEARVQAGALQQLRNQLCKQVHSASAQLETIALACRQQPSDLQLKTLEKRLSQFELSLSSLQRHCVAQLEQLGLRNAEAASDLEGVSRGLHASLEVPQTTAQPVLLLGLKPLLPAKAASKAPIKPSSKPTTQHELPLEVKECDDFMERHGPTGGWHPDDHAEFERILKACRGIYSHTVQICCEQLGLLHSRTAIIQHAREQHKLAVQQWKISKEESQRQQLEAQQVAARQRQEQGRAALLQRQQELAGKLSVHKQRKAEEYQQRAKDADKQALSRQRTPEPETMRRLAERNQQLVQKRGALVQRPSNQAQEREARLRELQKQASAEFDIVDRDPGRVLQATAAAQLRQLAITTEEREGKASGWIRNVQHRASPGWLRST